MVIRIDYETPVIDDTVADVFEVDDEGQRHRIGSMIFYEDLDQWNDTEFPGDVADQDPLICADKMIEFRK